MANNNLEAYLEAIQAAVEGGDIPPVPTPSWNHEQYLAAILAALVNGGGGSGGGGSGVLLVGLDMSTFALDKTWQEIVDAPFAVIKMPHDGEAGTVYGYAVITKSVCNTSAQLYRVVFTDPDPVIGSVNFDATTADGYPVFSQN